MKIKQKTESEFIDTLSEVKRQEMKDVHVYFGCTTTSTDLQ